MEKSHRKQWKIFQLIYIASNFFFIVIKKLQKIGKTFAST